MPRRPPVAALGLALALTGCSHPTAAAPAPADVAVAVATPSGSAAPQAVTRCQALLAALPAQLAAGIRRRSVLPDSGRTAAWGDPPIALQCGVPVGDQKDQPFGADGVLWAVHDTGAGQRWTTTDRSVNIALDIPDRYDAQAEIVIRLSPAIKATLPAPQAAPGG